MKRRLFALNGVSADHDLPSTLANSTRFRRVSRQIQQRLPQQPFVSLCFSERPFPSNLYLRQGFPHFRNHPLDHRLQRHPLVWNFQRPRILQKLRHHMRDVSRLLQDSFGVVQSLRRGRLRADHLRVTRNRRQRVLELVRNSRGKFAQRRQVFLQLDPLLQRGQFRQIRQQADRPANFALAAPDR